MGANGSSMQIHSSRLLGPAPVLEFTMTLMDDLRIDWQFQNFSGRHWSPPEIRLLLMRLAQTLPNEVSPPPEGGPQGVAEAPAVGSPLFPPTPAAPAEVSPQGVCV